MGDSNFYTRPDLLMRALSDELLRLRDSMLNLAEALEEVQMELPTSQSHEVRKEVERYLCSLRKS